MDGNRICSFVGCDNTSQNKNYCFYEFPEDFNLCIQWVEIIGSRELFEEFAFQGPELFRGRFICSDHFTEEDFIDSNDIFSGLKKDAVPFYFISNRKNEDPLGNICVKNEPPEVDFWDTSEISSSVFPVDLLNNVKVEEVSSQFILSGESSALSNMEPEKESAKKPRKYIKESSAAKQAYRKLQNARRASLRRNEETPEEKEKRRKANAERQARKRMMETPEQKEIRRVKDLLRARRRRQTETEEETKLRRLYDASRAQARRQNESEEEKNLRRMKDLKRVTNRRRNETDEERLKRLRKNREYSAKRRYIQRLEQELNHPKNLIDDNFLLLRNFEEDVTTMNASLFQPLSSFTEQQKNNELEARLSNEVGNKNEENLIISNSHIDNNLTYSQFLSNSSIDSCQSFDGTSEESMRSSSNDSYDNPVQELISNEVGEISGQT